MSEPTPATSKGNLPYAALAAAFGVFFILQGARLLPVSASADQSGPQWLVLCVGLAFLLAGIVIAIQTLGHANAAGELPAAAPRWMRSAQLLAAFTIAACLASIGSWVAFGPGERDFSGSFLFFGPAINSALGRVAFGLGAVMIWLCLAAIAVSRLHKFFTTRNRDAG